MAIFTGKIIEAYFANSENDTVEVIYDDGEKAVNHYLKVDFSDDDFKDLISEYDTDKIAEATIQRNRKYAQQLSDMVDAGIKVKTDVKAQISVEELVNKLLVFDKEDDEAKEILHTLKLQVFDQQKVKDSDNKELKARLRSAKTPVDLLSVYKEIDD
jgi:hypothetical protein